MGQTCDGSPLLHSPQQRTQQRGPGPRPHLTQAANTRISPEGSVCAPLAALAWKRKDSLRADPGDGVSQRLTHRQACACTQQSLDQCATPRGFWRNPGPPVRLGDKQRSGQTPSQDDLQRIWRTAGGPRMCCPRGGTAGICTWPPFSPFTVPRHPLHRVLGSQGTGRGPVHPRGSAPGPWAPPKLLKSVWRPLCGQARPGPGRTQPAQRYQCQRRPGPTTDLASRRQRPRLIRTRAP